MKTLENIERDVALGLLARAALALSQHSDAEDATNSESDIRSSIIKEARESLGLALSDSSQAATEKVLDFLDEESDKLLSADEQSALSRLAERGDLPSDLYEISVNQSFQNALGKYYHLESEIITTAVRAPDSEQHFTKGNSPEEPAMVSLFVKLIRTKWPVKDFYAIIVAQRNGFRLDVNQAWRMYPSRFENICIEKPLAMLKSFSDQYGADVTVQGRTGHFFMHLSGEIPQEFNIHRRDGLFETYVGRFALSGTSGDIAAFLVSINMRKYRALLRDMGVDRDEIITPFVTAPKPRY